MSATENLARSAELALAVGIGEDGPFPAVVTLYGRGADQPPTAGMAHVDSAGVPRWNGWLAEPRFDLRTAMRIAEMLDRYRAAGFESDRLRLIDEDRTPVFALDRPTEPDWSGEIIPPDADGRYAIGAYGWCWYEWDGSL